MSDRIDRIRVYSERGRSAAAIRQGRRTALRTLKTLIVAMGVLIVLGTVGLVAIIAGRLAAHRPTPGPILVLLGEPSGTRLAGIAATADTLILQLQGGGPDRAVIVEPHSLRVISRIVPAS